VVRGQYVWNAQGGLIHFTHHGTGSESGWILVRGKLYAWVEKVRDKEVENLASRWEMGGRPGTGLD
ncbi:MAG: DUF3465 domain-containing protein, partial [Chloroflexi bacterium]|nr:DUF3465 domain-containing protein [Chloroflexota bacterium]